jgi:hypothetical protein
MTQNEQKVKAWFDEWKQQRFPFIEGEVYYSLDNAISFAAFCLNKRDVLPEVEGEQWQSLNHRLLVNFLHLPEEHQIHLMESILVKRPKLKETLNASKGDDK